MVFSSIPPYLDPSNWHQQPPPPPLPNHHHLNQPGGGTNHPHHLQPPPPPPPPPPAQSHGGGIRPGSMADRARQANIPMPEAPLKCPRCDSTNTKFCYFNNYSLSQPRHFCKTCRRYWTRGGALRSVPVGGGCRRNKRSKGSSSKSPATSSDMSVSGGAPVSSGISSGGFSHGSEILGLGGVHLPSLRLMPSLQYMTDFGSGDQMGMNLYSGIMPPPLGGGSSNFSASTTTLGGGSNGGSLLGGNMDRLRLAQAAQFPFLQGGSEPYTFDGNLEPSDFITQMRPKAPPATSHSTQLVPPVKMEDNNNNNTNNNNNNNQEVNFSRQFLGVMNPPPGNDHQFQWNTATAWTDLSGFSSSSTSNNPP